MMTNLLEALEQMHDTAGAAAMDQGGNLAAGTSTGGLAGAGGGRIGWAHDGPAFATAYASADVPEPVASLSREEERRG